MEINTYDADKEEGPELDFQKRLHAAAETVSELQATQPLPQKNETLNRTSIIVGPENIPVTPNRLNLADLPTTVSPTETTVLSELSEKTESLKNPEVIPTTGRFDAIKKTFRNAYERFISRFKGEVQPEDEKGYEKTWEDDAKKTATGVLNFVATYTGLKLALDLPPWFYQKFFTNPAERKRIRIALLNKEKE